MEIILSITPLELNEKLVNSLEKLILNQIDIVKNTPTSQGLERGNYYEKHPGSIKATIASLLYKWGQDLTNKKFQYMVWGTPQLKYVLIIKIHIIVNMLYNNWLFNLHFSIIN